MWISFAINEQLFRKKQAIDVRGDADIIRYKQIVNGIVYEVFLFFFC